MLLLIQNEIGQIIARRLTRSENKFETESVLLSKVQLRIERCESKPVVIVSDNANAVRQMVFDVFGENAVVKQDPFHVIQRFTEKIVKAKKSAFSKRMSRAIFTSGGELRQPDQAVLEIQAAVDAMKANDLTVPNEIWQGTVKNNIAQTKQFDLFVPSNTYEEGGKIFKIVSTSQLEGLHSKFKKLVSRSVSMEIGMRILNIFLLEVGQHFILAFELI